MELEEKKSRRTVIIEASSPDGDCTFGTEAWATQDLEVLTVSNLKTIAKLDKDFMKGSRADMMGMKRDNLLEAMTAYRNTESEVEAEVDSRIQRSVRRAVGLAIPRLRALAIGYLHDPFREPPLETAIRLLGRNPPDLTKLRPRRMTIDSRQQETLGRTELVTRRLPAGSQARYALFRLGTGRRLHGSPFGTGRCPHGNSSADGR